MHNKCNDTDILNFSDYLNDSDDSEVYYIPDSPEVIAAEKEAAAKVFNINQKKENVKNELKENCIRKYGYYDEAMRFFKKENTITLIPNFNNYVLVMKHLFPKLAYSIFDGRIYIDSKPLSTKLRGDIEIAMNNFYLGGSINNDILKRVVNHVALQNEFNPLKDYFTKLPKCKTDYLNNYLVDICKVKDTPINRILGRKWLISAVARAMVPGTEVHSALIFCGDQGAGKTSFFKILNPKPEYYISGKVDLDNIQKATQTFRGKFLIEFGELSSFKKNELESVKDYLTNSVDTYVPKFENDSVNVPRMMVFGGTSNNMNILVDKTGNRRFWCVEVERNQKVDLDKLKEIKEALWSEAVQAYESGESHFLNEEESEMLNISNEQFMESDPLTDWMISKLEDYNELGRISGLDANSIAQGYDPKTKVYPQKVSQIMVSLGWFSKHTNKGTVYLKNLGDK